MFIPNAMPFVMLLNNHVILYVFNNHNSYTVAYLYAISKCALVKMMHWLECSPESGECAYIVCGYKPESYDRGNNMNTDESTLGKQDILLLLLLLLLLFFLKQWQENGTNAASIQRPLQGVPHPLGQCWGATGHRGGRTLPLGSCSSFPRSVLGGSRLCVSSQKKSSPLRPRGNSISFNLPNTLTFMAFLAVGRIVFFYIFYSNTFNIHILSYSIA